MKRPVALGNAEYPAARREHTGQAAWELRGATHSDVNLARPALMLMPSDGSMTTAAQALITRVNATATPRLDCK